jgi:hypothetical protein
MDINWDEVYNKLHQLQGISLFIRENESLFWGVKPDEKENISLNVLVETILNFRDEKKVKSLFDLMRFEKNPIPDLIRLLRTPRNYHPWYQLLS